MELTKKFFLAGITLLTLLSLGSFKIQAATVTIPDPAGVQTVWTNACGGIIDLRWGPSPGATGYKVYRSDSYASSPYVLLADVGNTFSYQDVIGPTAATNRDYYYRVTAYNSAGESVLNQATPAEGIASTPICPPPASPVMNGVSTSNVCGGNDAISWQPSPGATGYSIYRGSGGKNFSLVGTTSATSFNDSPGPGFYTYQVSAFSNFGTSTPAGTSGFASDACPPPISVACSIGNPDPRVGSNVWWEGQASGGPGGNSYDYEWSTTGLKPNEDDYVGGEGPFITKEYNTPGIKSATVTATQGTTSGTATATCSITVNPPFPSTPVTASAATTDMCGANVAVQVGGSSYATSYTIYRSTSSSGPYVVIGVFIVGFEVVTAQTPARGLQPGA